MTEDGSAAVELVLITPVLLLLMMFALVAGRFALARNQVIEAARDAAREASTWPTARAATGAGVQRGLDSLHAGKVSCQGPQVVIDASRLHPGGEVVADVRCTVALDDVLGMRIVGARTFSARAVAVVDTFRSGG
ncbi:MAG: pilus assembly protein [Actinomycetota bacterium]|nr:pilus assembly protein [Actinomycetota bacterium]